MLTKQDIIKVIQDTAENGVPLGQHRLEKETGIRPADWGKFWARLGDAQGEAGFTPNTLTSRYDENLILQKWVELTRELGKFPVPRELEIKARNDKGFPSRGAMSRIGNRQQIIKKLLDFAISSNLSDIVTICENLIENTRDSGDSAETLRIGAVYLFRHDKKHYKIGKSDNTVRRGQELRIQMPGQLDLIHEIKTDDPFGVETYWHNRFKDKNVNGEWFELNGSDVKAFKSWRKII